MKLLDLSRLYSKFGWAIALFGGLVLAFWQFILVIVNAFNAVKKGNTTPEERKEEIGEADANGFKQVEQQLPSSQQVVNDTPVATNTATVTEVKATGTAGPSKKDDGSTQGLIDKLDELIEGK